MPFIFESGRLCVDFIATEFGPPAARVERLNNQYDLRSWLAQSGAVHGGGPIESPELRRARAVRALIDGLLLPRGLPDSRYLERARHRLNLMARRPRIVLQARGERVILRGGFEEFLTELAIDTLALLDDSSQLARVRRCAAKECQQSFFDRSAGGGRRWCSRACGNRRSSATYRAAAARALSTPSLASASAFSLPGSPA